MEWRHPKTITGPPAENDRYLQRTYINEEFWRYIQTSHHILFTAPRRVGKSSVMLDIEKNPPAGYIVKYKNIQTDNTQSEFFQRLLNMIVEQLDLDKGLKQKIGEFLKSRKISEISVKGIKIEKVEINYKEELLALVERLGEEKLRIVLLLDEFPDVIKSIAKNEGNASAIELLSTLRAIRQDKNFAHFSLVFAGSIGLDHVVASIDRLALINDLKSIPISVLENEEGRHLLEILLDGASIIVEPAVRSYLLEKTAYLLPYYIQLMVEKCDEIAHKRNQPSVNEALINEAFNLVIEEGKNFPDWENRLKDYLDKHDAVYCTGLLTRCAHRRFTLQEAYNFSKTAVPVTHYNTLINDVLIKDGYIVNDNQQLVFLSPFLKQWWKNRHPKFEIED